MKVVASWSGGKDSCYAYYLAAQQGHEVISLLTMMMSEEKSNFHMIPSGILGCPIRRYRNSTGKTASYTQNLRE